VKIVTRAVAIANLTAYVGRDLRALASTYGITTYETGRQNKGWRGLILERLAGLETSNAKAPNGLTFELKSVSFHYVKDKLVPKETMAITMINPTELRAHTFFESHCWAKLKTMVFCAVMWHGRNAESAELLKVASFDFSETDELIRTAPWLRGRHKDGIGRQPPWLASPPIAPTKYIMGTGSAISRFDHENVS
jgi:hypothetical protein